MQHGETGVNPNDEATYKAILAGGDDLIGRIEPGVLYVHLGSANFLASIAISLKRIADLLETKA